jgi:hypothetical protein
MGRALSSSGPWFRRTIGTIVATLLATANKTHGNKSTTEIYYFS